MANKKVNQLTTKSSVLTGDLVPLADASTGQLYKATLSDLGAVIGSAVASVNGLVGVVVLDTDDIQELSSPTNKWFTDTRARAALSASSPLTYNSGTGAFGIQAATGSQNGYLSSTDWTTFNNKVSTSRTLTINGTAYDLSADRSWSVDSMVYPGAGIPVSTGTAWGTSITNNSTNWNTAYSSRISSLTTDGASGSATLASNVLNIPTYTLAGLGGQPALSGTGFVKISGTTISYDNSTYLTTTSASGTYLTITNAAAQYQPIGTYVAGSGSGSRLARWLDGSTLAVAQIWDDGTNIGVGGAPGAYKLDVTGTLRVTDTATFTSIISGGFTKSGGTSTQFLKADGSVDSSTYLTTSSAASQYQPIGTYAGGSGESSRLARWTSTSNLSVAQIWDDGTNIGIGQAPGSFKLDVTGTARVTGATTFSSSVTASGDIIAAVGAGIVSGGGSYAIGPSSTRGIIALNGSGDQILTFSTQSYIYNNSSLFRMLSSSDIDFVVGGTQRMIIKNTGNVGIGTTAPASKLQIEGTGTGAWLTINRTDTGTNLIDYTQSGTRLGYIGYIGSEMWLNNATASDISIRTSGSERMRITSGGNVAIGATSAAYKLTVVGDVRGYKLIGGEAGVGAGNYTIFSNDDNVGYIDTVKAVNSGDFQFRFTGTTKVTISTAGNVTATAFFESSDKTIKTLIEDNYQAKGIESVTAKLYLKNGVEELGYFAQDVQPIIPSAVSKGADGLLNLSYREVHTAKIARLEKELEELKAKLK